MAQSAQTRRVCGFQSSPVPKYGCNPPNISTSDRIHLFQSSPVPKDGCNRADGSFGSGSGCPFQSSPVPKDGCNRHRVCGCKRTAVSILTRPEGRVQPGDAAGTGGVAVFQSSPVPKDGCNRRPRLSPVSLCLFQSSPVPKDGCNPSCGEPTHLRSSFNPHPSRRTGATLPQLLSGYRHR